MLLLILIKVHFCMFNSLILADFKRMEYFFYKNEHQNTHFNFNSFPAEFIFRTRDVFETIMPPPLGTHYRVDKSLSWAVCITMYVQYTWKLNRHFEHKINRSHLPVLSEMHQLFKYKSLTYLS